jgi:hypothetical protein
MRWSLLLWIATLPTPSLSLMSSSRKLELREETRALWKHAYGSYKTHAFPSDELLPLSCKPQGHDRVALDNTAVNDVCGDYVLTLVDSLDSFPVLGDREGWEEAVRETIMHVSFERDVRVQVSRSCWLGRWTGADGESRCLRVLLGWLEVSCVDSLDCCCWS